MLTSSSNHPRSFLMTTVLSVARSRVTRGPAYGSVTPKLMMPSSFRVQFSREASSDAAASASMARGVRTRMSAAAPIAPVAAHSRRRWVRAGLRPQQSRQAPVFAATAAPSRARWGRNVLFASAGIGCAIGVIGAATSPASPAGAWFFSSPPTGATSVIALQAVAAAAQMVAELGAAVLASVAARGSDLGRWVGVGAVGSRTHADGSGGDPQLWWLAGDKTDDSALLGWLSSGTERAGSVAARLERFGAWCVGRRTAHQEEAGDAIPMLAMFTAPLFMLLYALLCCF